MPLRTIQSLKLTRLEKGLEGVKGFFGMESLTDSQMQLANLKGRLVKVGTIIESLAKGMSKDASLSPIALGLEEFSMQLRNLIDADEVSEDYDVVVMAASDNEMERKALMIDSCTGDQVFCYVTGVGACLMNKGGGFNFEEFCSEVAESENPEMVFTNEEEGRLMVVIVTEQGGLKFPQE